MDPTQAEAAKQQLQADAYYNANPQPAAPVSEKAAEQKEEAAYGAARYAGKIRQDPDGR